MYKYILQGAGQINWMALFALLTFVTVFLISVVMVFGRKQSYLDKMSNLPLEDSSNLNDENLITYD